MLSIVYGDRQEIGCVRNRNGPAKSSALSSHKQLVTIVPWANMETTSELIRTTTSAAEIDKENFYDDSAFLGRLIQFWNDDSEGNENAVVR
ncbi:hypothetical protein RB195_019219 [Necator americanus]|uniref:Uncharacterized protein n=1 Tax=Necator americanus TaxID=51031 RepID=A0ABR1CGQ6_NECAM